MFLGIRYNIWHGIIAFIGEFGIALFLVSRTGVVLAFLFAFLLGLMAQALYECYQLYFTDVQGIYGSYLDFVIDSKDDFKNFFIGSGFALVCFILLSLT